MILQFIHQNFSAVVTLLLTISGMLLFLSVILRLNELKQLVLGFRRMQGIIVELERTVNELQGEVRRSLILTPKSPEPAAQARQTVVLDRPVELTPEVKTVETEEKKEETLKSPDVPASFVSGLFKSRRGLIDRIKSIFSGTTLSPEALDDLEGQLLGADLGPKVVARLRSSVESVLKDHPVEENELPTLFTNEIERIFSEIPPATNIELRSEKPLVVLIVGVNGVGKTTTAAKLAKRFSDAGKKVLLVAADTFRAAAVEQLQTWGNRLSIDVSIGAEGAKPQTVVFDAAKRAVAENYDVVLVDTAGRLHNKANLMQELEGVRNALEKHIPGAPHETFLVLDGTTGQNAIQQAKEFNESVKLSGLVVTKLDGTSKGGVVIAVSEFLKLPVRFVGLGEKPADLVPFDSHEFARALFVE